MSCVLGAWLVLSTALADATKQAKADEMPSLIERLGSDDFKQREVAQERLAKFGELAREALKKASRTHRDVEVVHRCRALLRRLGPTATERRVSELIVQLADDSFDVRASASKELVKIGRPALELLETARGHPDIEIARRVEQAVAAIKAAR